MDYTGRIITKNPQTPSANGAPGVWTLDEAMQYSKQGKWPPGYQISRSVRLRSSASAYFNRTPASAGNRRTWTWSGWVKLGSLSTTLNILYAYSADSDSGLCQLSFQSNQLRIQGYSASFLMVSTPVYRDPSAWYHIVYKVDTTQATAADRVRVYVNGVEITAWATNTPPPQNTDTAVNNNVAHNIGRNTRNSNDYFDGYFAEVNLIDGQALTPASFGYFDTYTGVWQPAPYTGTYGTNGFYLNFKDPTSTTTIGYDYSGNSNNWTANNISVTAGTTYDSMVDVPINWGTDTGAGGVVRGNYCTLNPLDSSNVTVSNGNLQVTYATAAWSGARASFAIPKTGKWKWEVTPTTMTYGFLAIAMASANLSTSGYTATYVYAWYLDSGEIRYSNNNQVTVAAASANDICEVRVDSGVVSLYRNNVLQWTYTQTLNDITADYFPAAWVQNGAVHVYNFGQRPFAYTVSGYKSLCTQNISVPTVLNGASYMAATLYTGTGGTLTISNGANNTIGTTFQPDWVWVKSRSAATDHKLTDSVRGATKALISDTTGAETTDTNGVTAFGTTGFTLGSDTVYNNSGATYIGWQWKASGSTVSNTTGSITSTVSTNTTAGFSIVTYTGTGANATVGHGIGAAPSMVIIFERSPGGDDHIVYHSSLTSNQYAIRLNTTAAQTGPSANYWNSTSPTSSVFSVGISGESNQSTATYVAYCFAPIAGYSAFGSYTGNGSTDGPFVYTGMRPRWVMVKRTDAAGARWAMADTSRSPYNVGSQMLYADAANAEDPGGGATYDIISNGFKIRAIDGNWNTSGGTYVFVAFAENPFTIARAR